jgi:hypothetical protein
MGINSFRHPDRLSIAGPLKDTSLGYTRGRFESLESAMQQWGPSDRDNECVQDDRKEAANGFGAKADFNLP